MRIGSTIRLLIVAFLIFTLISTGIMISNVENIKSDSTIINLAGSIRGETQRLIKLESSGNQSEDIITYLDRTINKFLENDYGFNSVESLLLDDIKEIDIQWKELKKYIYISRITDDYSETILRSENYYTITDHFVISLEKYSIIRVEKIKFIQLLLVITNLILLGVLWILSKLSITNPLNHLITTISNLNISEDMEKSFLDRKDEIGDLSRGLQRIIDEMREVNSVVVETNSKLSITSGELKKLSNIIDKSINIIFITNFDGIISYVNSNFEKTTGFSAKEAIGRNPRFLAGGGLSNSEYKDMWDIIKSGKTWRGVLKNRKKDGSFYWANGFISPIEGLNGEITDFLAIQEDITEEVSVKKKLEYLSNYDKLTGIINRDSFLSAIDSEINNAEDTCGILLHIGIDGFNFVNTSFGHGIGDQLLVSFSEFIIAKINLFSKLNNLSKRYLIGRLDGDEFGIFIFSRNEQIGLELGKYLKESIEKFQFLNGVVSITTSIGISMFPENGLNGGELLTKAVAATIQVKQEGQNNYLLYKEDEQYANKSQEIMEVKQMINHALEDDSIIPWYQPIYNIETGKIHHYEVLARLINRNGKVVYPNSFIPIAEKFGLISNIDKRIFEKSVKYLGELKEQGKNYTFSVNISGKNLGDKDILEHILEVLDNSNVDSENIVFEITETNAINNLEKAALFVKTLKDKGCKFALDDFGIGFTSFVHISKLNVDFVKIDGSFVKNIVTSEMDREIVESIGGMCKALGIETIAEFVETKEILDILTDTKIDFAQGYFIGKPLVKVLD